MMQPITYLVISCALTIAKLAQGPLFARAMNAAIVKSPSNQYILVEGVATLICTTRGAFIATWSINGNRTDNRQHQSYYEALGVRFSNSSNVNLTMVVPACLTAKVSNIRCIAEDDNYGVVDESETVQIHVLKTFRPDPPHVSVEDVYNPPALPQLNVTLEGRPLWQGYGISEFRINVTNISSGVLLEKIIAPNNTFQNHTVQIQINKSLFEFATHQCYSLSISASAVSPCYTGESESTTVSTVMLKSKQVFDVLPDVCTYQNINYTIIAEELGASNETVEPLMLGPFRHQGSGVVSQKIGSPELREGSRYSVRVTMESVTGTSESSEYFYSTKREFEFCTREHCMVTQSHDASSVYKIAMGISLGIVLLLLLAFSVLLVCFCVHHQRTRQQGNCSTRNQVHNINRTMVPNPIYADGQVYDSIDPPQFTSLKAGSHPQTFTPRYSYSPSHNESSLDNVQHTQETIQITYPTCAEVSTPLSNTYSKPGESDLGNGARSINNQNVVPGLPPMYSTVLKKCRKDRNKLHLTLPGASSIPSAHRDGLSRDNILESCQDGMKSEESQYVEMSQTGTLRQQAIQSVQ